ncbi:hypothetical protein ONZ45_g8624 [Pleurotus djamor]|nr:hypothetical protein ONZ45_g8624 [Pleurotus djamor]
MISQHPGYNNRLDSAIHPVPPSPHFPSNSPTVSTMKTAPYASPDIHYCQASRYGGCVDAQGHACSYSTHHAAPCYAASTSQLAYGQSNWGDPNTLNSGPMSEQQHCSTNDYSWTIPISFNPDDVSSHVDSSIRSVSPAESSDSDLSYTACDETLTPALTDRGISRPSQYTTAMHPSAFTSQGQTFVPAAYPLQHLLSSIPQPVTAASHPTAPISINSTSSHLDLDPSYIASAPLQPSLSDVTASPPIVDEPIEIHHPRPRRPFLNRLLMHSAAFDEEPGNKEKPLQQVKEQRNVRNFPLSSSALLCQPAPPSVMFHGMVGQTVFDGNSAFNPGIAIRDSNSGFHYPYDFNVSSQPSLACSCGCMGSYSAC